MGVRLAPIFIALAHYLYGVGFNTLKYCTMQILVLGNPLETAIALDQKRLDHEISVCDRMIKDIKAGKAHKSLIAFQGHLWWLQLYCNTLDFYRKGLIQEAAEMSYFAERYKPAFIDRLIQDNKRHLAKK